MTTNCGSGGATARSGFKNQYFFILIIKFKISKLMLKN